MKALLKFGGFTQFIDIAQIKHSYYIPHPLGLVQMHDGDYGSADVTITKKLEFDYVQTDRIDDVEVAIYKFVRVS